MLMMLVVKTLVHLLAPDCMGYIDISKQWIDTIFVPLPQKGQLTHLNNWRGVSLLGVVSLLVL